MLTVVRASLFTAVVVLSACLFPITDISLLAGELSVIRVAGAKELTQDEKAEQDKTESTGKQDVAPKDDTPSGLTIASVEAALGELEKNSSLDSSVKDLLRPKYKQAIEALKTAADNAARAKQYQAAITTAPDEAAKLKSDLQMLPTVEVVDVEASGEIEGLNSEEIQKKLNAKRTLVANLESERAEVTADLAGVKGRPAEISDRLPKAESELGETAKKLASPEMAADSTSPGRVSDRIVLSATESRLQSEVEMLKQEQLSQSSREEMLQAKQELLSQKLANAKRAVKIFENAKNRILKNEAQQIRGDIEAILEKIPEDDLKLRELAKEVQDMVTELETVIENLKLVSIAKEGVTARLNRLTEEYQYVDNQLKLGGSGDVIAQLLFALRNGILRLADNSDLTKQLPKLDEVHLTKLQTNQKGRQHVEIEKEFAEHRTINSDKLFKLRLDVLTKLHSQQTTLG